MLLIQATLLDTTTILVRTVITLSTTPKVFKNQIGDNFFVIIARLQVTLYKGVIKFMVIHPAISCTKEES